MMKVELFDFYPVHELLDPVDGSKVYMNKYWIVFQGKVLRYKTTKAWQCNSLQSLVEGLIKDNPMYEGCEVVFYNFLYIPQ